MEQNIFTKKGFQVLLWVIGCLLVAVLVPSAVYQGYSAVDAVRNPSNPNNTLNVMGSAVGQAMPDAANLSFTLLADGKDEAAVRAANQKQLDAFTKAAEGLGIAESDISASEFTITPPDNSGSYSNAQQSSNLYQASEGIFVVLRATTGLSEKMNQLFAVASQNGLSSNTGTYSCFGFNTDNAGVKDLLGQAVEQGRARARQIADAAGLALGKLTSVEDYTTSFASESDIISDPSNCKGPSPVPGTDIKPQSISVSLNETFELK